MRIMHYPEGLEEIFSVARMTENTFREALISHNPVLREIRVYAAQNLRNIFAWINQAILSAAT